ncbi:MAG: universal stress protein [Bdellovibrionales bacterium]
MSRPVVLTTDDMNQSLYGTARSRTLFLVGVQLAHLLRADLHMIHVDDPNDLNFREPVYRKYLASLSEKGKVRNYKLDDHSVVKIYYRLLEGSPFEKILEAIEHTQNLALVVMGTYGRWGFRRWLIGSVTRKVIQRGHASVVLVGRSCVQAKRDRNPLGVCRLLAVVDKSVPQYWIDHVLRLGSSPKFEIQMYELIKKTWFSRFRNTQSLKRLIAKSYRENKVTHVIIPKDFPVSLRSLAGDAPVPIIVSAIKES